MNKHTTFLIIAILTAVLVFPDFIRAQDTASVPSPVYTVPKEPFQKEVSIMFKAGKLEGFGSFEVPGHKRLVIEHVSAHIVLPNGQKITEARIETLQSGGGAMASHYLTTYTEGSRLGVGDYFSASQDMRLYAIGVVRFGFFRTDSTSTGLVDATVSGYIVDY